MDTPSNFDQVEWYIEDGVTSGTPNIALGVQVSGGNRHAYMVVTDTLGGTKTIDVIVTTDNLPHTLKGVVDGLVYALYLDDVLLGYAHATQSSMVDWDFTTLIGEKGDLPSTVYVSKLSLSECEDDFPTPPTLDPLWANVVLLLQGGTLTDKSSYARTVTSSGSTLNDATWTKNGVNSIKIQSVFLGQNGYVTWPRSAELQFGTAPFCIEGWFKTDSASGVDMYLYTDRLGGGGDPLAWSLYRLGATGTQIINTNNSSNTAIGPSLTVPAEFYACLERVGDTLYGSINGVVATPKVLTAGYSFNAPVHDARIGLAEATSNSWILRLAQFRVTMGASRYGGTNFTPPALTFPEG